MRKRTQRTAAAVKGRRARRRLRASAARCSGVRWVFSTVTAPRNGTCQNLVPVLLAEAGYPNGFDAGAISADFAFTSTAEAVVNYFRVVGIRATVRPLERAAFFKEYQEKRLRHIIQSASAAFGNAATRLDAFVASGGPFTYGTYADIEGLIREQASEMDRGRREAILHRIQQLMHDKVMYAPLMEPAILGAHGPRVAESGIGLITNMGASAPYEDLKLKSK